MENQKRRTQMSGSAIEKQEQEQSAKTTEKFNKEGNGFDETKYLQMRLKPGEDRKTVTIRLLPVTEDNLPFQKVIGHQIRVPKEVQENGWKRFICPAKNGDGKIDDCPFCQLSSNAYKARLNAKSQAEKETYKKIIDSFHSKEYWVIRCIERGKEEDGPKFWMFPHQDYKQDGIYNKMMEVYHTRKEESEDGTYNIFDLYDGKDLNITIKRDKQDSRKHVYTVTDAGKSTPLSEDGDLIEKWVDETRNWKDYYKVKPYTYMEIIANGGIPVWSSEEKGYVAKADNKSEEDENTTQTVSTEEKEDYSDVKDSEDLPF